MSDLISRSALIEEIKNIEVQIDFEALNKLVEIAKDQDVLETIIKYVMWQTSEIAMQHIENAPTVEANPIEWIPCSERLPEDETLLYWTTHEDGSLVLHGYKKSNGFIYNWEVDDLEKRKRQGQVIAWIPIFEPAPYNADMRKKVE